MESLNHTLESKKTEMMRLVAEEARCRNIFQNATQNKESLKRRLKRIDEEEYNAAREVGRHEKNETEARDEFESLKAEHEHLKEKIIAFRKQLEEISRVMSDKIKFIQSLEMEKNRADSKFIALKKMQDSYQWYKDGVKAIMQRNAIDSDNGEPGDIIGLMADILEPDHSYETAVEAVLGNPFNIYWSKTTLPALIPFNSYTKTKPEEAVLSLYPPSNLSSAATGRSPIRLFCC